jgi:hypothetical protein
MGAGCPKGVTEFLRSFTLEEEHKPKGMQFTVEIPDDVAARLSESGADLPRRALEGFALEELRSGHITELQLRKMLGLARIEMDSFLKAHGVYQTYTLEDFEKEREALKDLGI